MDKSRPIVVFGSFQDLLGTNESGGIKTKNEFIHSTNWDLVIFDEYHFGAWKERAKELFEKEDEENEVDFDAENIRKMKQAMPSMKHGFLFQHDIICFSQEHHSEPSIPENL